jgi:hypothetical protein
VIRIFKYALPAYGEAVIDANVVRWLHVEWLRDTLQVWAEVSVAEPGATPMRCRLWVALTGEEVPKSENGFQSEHLGSAILLGPGAARSVVHVYRLWP